MGMTAAVARPTGCGRVLPRVVDREAETAPRPGHPWAVAPQYGVVVEGGGYLEMAWSETPRRKRTVRGPLPVVEGVLPWGGGWLEAWSRVVMVIITWGRRPG